MPSPKRVIAVTVVLWGLSVIGLEAARIWSVLSGPPDPEYYTQGLSFQLFASAFLVATKWLPLVVVVVLLELVALHVASRLAGPNTGSSIMGATPNKSLERTRER